MKLFFLFLVILCISAILVIIYQVFVFKRNLAIEKENALKNTVQLNKAIKNTHQIHDNIDVRNVFNIEGVSKICIVNSTTVSFNFGIPNPPKFNLDSNIWAIVFINKEKREHIVRKYWKWQEPVIVNSGCYSYKNSVLTLEDKNYLIMEK